MPTDPLLHQSVPPTDLRPGDKLVSFADVISSGPLHGEVISVERHGQWGYAVKRTVGRTMYFDYAASVEVER